MALFGAAWVAGCQLGGTEDVGVYEQEILGGSIAVEEFPEVCVIDVVLPPDEEENPQDPTFCTCTLVSETVVLTAARCLDENLEADTVGDLTLKFGSGFEDGTAVAIEEVELHRYFNPDQQGKDALGLIRLAAPPPGNLTPAVLNEAPLTDELFEETITLVGFGESEEGNDNTDGLRRQVDVPIRSIEDTFIFAGTESATTCEGDSGGPGYIDLGQGPVVAAVTLRHGQDSCFESIQRVRVDQHVADFIYPYIDRFEGACTADGVCVEGDECRSPDPDCDPCLWGNECQEDCPTRDWDCPLGSFLGEACEKNGDCEEGGRCVAALDDESFTYCTRPCDPAGAGQGCPAGMTCEDLGDGAGECIFETPTPGSQGFPCTTPIDCRSGICEDSICVNECAGPSDCPEPFTCGPSNVEDGAMVCLGEAQTGGGGFGFCSASGRGGLSWLVWVLGALFALAFAGRRRRA